MWPAGSTRLLFSDEKFICRHDDDQLDTHAYCVGWAAVECRHLRAGPLDGWPKSSEWEEGFDLAELGRRMCRGPPPAPTSDTPRGGVCHSLSVKGPYWHMISPGPGRTDHQVGVSQIDRPVMFSIEDPLPYDAGVTGTDAPAAAAPLARPGALIGYARS